MSVLPSEDSESLRFSGDAGWSGSPFVVTAFSRGESESLGHLMSSGISVGECCIVATGIVIRESLSRLAVDQDRRRYWWRDVLQARKLAEVKQKVSVEQLSS